MKFTYNCWGLWWLFSTIFWHLFVLKKYDIKKKFKFKKKVNSVWRKYMYLKTDIKISSDWQEGQNLWITNGNEVFSKNDNLRDIQEKYEEYFAVEIWWLCYFRK